jgi:3-methyladenine DNA glycosylase/8-oxoguanine DNA glycosylase
MDTASLRELVVALTDADAPVRAITNRLGDDPFVGSLVRKRPGLRIPGTVDPFELAIRAILGQQISVAGASTLAGRIAATWGSEVALAPGGLCRMFPGAQQLVDAPVERVGLSRSRAGAIRGVAAAVSDGRLDLRPGQEDLGAAEEALLAINGIGPWTAAYIALRGLRNRDAIPIGDLGLRQAMGCRKASEVAALAEGWRPWRGYGAVHLWSTFLEP